MDLRVIFSISLFSSFLALGFLLGFLLAPCRFIIQNRTLIFQCLHVPYENGQHKRSIEIAP